MQKLDLLATGRPGSLHDPSPDEDKKSGGSAKAGGSHISQRRAFGTQKYKQARPMSLSPVLARRPGWQNP
jgi:hypothetical protein